MSRKCEFLKIPDENGGFICVQSHIFEEELDGTKRHYFEPSFRLMNDKVVRQDTFWEKRDVIGYKSKGYLLSSEKEEYSGGDQISLNLSEIEKAEENSVIKIVLT